MKNTFKWVMVFAVIMAITSFQTSHAQINYGLKGGLNFANVGGDDVEDAEMRVGFHVGGFLDISLAGLVAVETGLYYSQKGYQYNESFMGVSFEFENVSSYLDIPVVMKVSPLPLIHFYAGPQASILLDNTYKFNGESESDTEGMRDLDLALVIGAGVNVPGGLRASIGYDIGLTTLDEDGDFKAYNRVIKLTVGYRF